MAPLQTSQPKKIKKKPRRPLPLCFTSIILYIMANTCDAIAVVLKEAEAKLLRLIAESASAGDLAAVDEVRKAALQLRAIIGAGDSTACSTATRSSMTNSKKRKPQEQKRDAYPQFEVRNATLYRIGWSKKKKDRYEHKVPQAIVFCVAETMATLSRTRSGPFTAEQISSRIDGDLAVPIPNYQVYVVLGFLRSRDLIEQVGRDGYEIPNGFDKKLTAVWKSLA